MNDQNLIPLNSDKLTKSQRREICSKGGKASVQAKRQRKTFAEIFKTILDEQAEVMINGVKVKLAKKDLLAINLVNKTMTNKVNSSTLNGLKHIQATIGEAPIEKIEQTNYNIETKPEKMDIEKLKKVRKEVFGIDD